MGFFSGLGSALVGATGSLLGGAVSTNSAKKQAQQSFQQNYNAQKEFAQNSIQWRVQDAKKAGINPYAVVGGQTVGYTPQDSSYQDSFGQGISHGMNRIADAMGQLNLANVKAEVKGKELDNQKKALELANKAIKTQMGQTSKIFTNPIQEITGSKLVTFGNGEKRLVTDAEIDNLGTMAQGINTLFDRVAHNAISKANKEQTLLGFTGYGSNSPKNFSSYDWVRARAANIAEKQGILSGLASIPDFYLQKLINKAKRFFNPKNSYGFDKVK